MKKAGLRCAVICAAFAMLGGTASAAQQKSFAVTAKQSSGHGDRSGYIFNEKLYARGHQVGRDHIKITRDGKQFAVTALFRFHGGKIKVAGSLHRGNNQHLPIVGGRGKFHGITGDFTTTNISKGLERETFRYSR